MGTLAQTQQAFDPLLKKFGKSAGVIRTNERIISDLSGATYAGYLTSDTALEVVSTSTLDDNTTPGTGARYVTFITQNLAGVETTTTVALNGTVAVPWPVTGVISYRGYISDEVGTAAYDPEGGGANQGDITIRVAGAGANLARISANTGQTLMALYRVPMGKYLNLKKLIVSSVSNQRCTVRLKIRASLTSCWRDMATMDLIEHSSLEEWDGMLVWEGSDIIVTGVSTATGAIISASFKGTLHDVI